MTNESEHQSDEQADMPGESPGYEPTYSEPHYQSPDSGGEWEVPPTSDPVPDDATTHASPPDASPLTDDGFDTSDAGPGAPTEDGLAPGQSTPGGATSYDPPSYESAGSPSQPVGQWFDPQPAQPNRYGPPMGGMPPPSYAGGYAPMPVGYNPNWLAGPSEQGRSTLQLDYWLSVFFSWLPALIFYLTERDKNQLVDEHTKELLNFNITRLIVAVLTPIPIIGWFGGGIASLVLFVMAIMGAANGPDEYANGRVYRFPLTFRFIK